MAEQKQAELDLEVEPRQESVEIEVDEKGNAQQATSDVEVEQINEQEQTVSESKKRIDRLTKKMREAERREQAAIDYAKKIKAEAGKIVVFPGTIRHCVPKNNCKNRLVLAGNIIFKHTT